MLKHLIGLLPWWIRNEHSSIADIFLKKGPYLKMYSSYIYEFDKNVALLEEQCKKSPAFAKVVQEFEVMTPTQPVLPPNAQTSVAKLPCVFFVLSVSVVECSTMRVWVGEYFSSLWYVVHMLFIKEWNAIECLHSMCVTTPSLLLSVSLFLIQSSPCCANLALKHYMLKPIQRLPQYQLLLTG